MRVFHLVAILALAFPDNLFAQGLRQVTQEQYPTFIEPFPPFRIIGNVYYVGSRGLASYLITTPQGHILINSNLESDVPLIRASIEKLGFSFSDVKILLISHAHWDHDAGSAVIRKMTGAKYMVMDADVALVESGGKTDPPRDATAASSLYYEPTTVDRVLHHGDEVKLGDTTLVAHLTPGHTQGCTTWMMKATEAGRNYDLVILGSANINAGVKLISNGLYPQIVADYDRTFLFLKSLPVDVFLGAHGSWFNMETKYALMKDAVQNPFIDPEGYKKHLAQAEQVFRAELEKQKASR
jgi:metallo-beta-lactamase class B